MLCSDRAWNNFVNCEPRDHEWGSPRRAAAITCLFMSGANNGGLNSFLTSSWDLDASEVVRALGAVGAITAERQLERVLRQIGCALPVMTQSERWDILDERWPDDLDPEDDCLSEEADRELMAVLERHVAEHEDYYASLT